MSDNNHEKPAQFVPGIQPSDWRSRMDPTARERVVQKIINTLRRNCRRPEISNEVEKVARKFEEKVYTMALDKQDYLKRISVKMMSIEESIQNASANSSMAYSASGGPNPLHAAPGIVQSRDTQNSELLVQPANPPQAQPHQIIQSDTLSSAGVYGASSSAMTATSGLIHASGSNFDGQSSKISNISTIPPNLVISGPEWHIPSNPVPVSMGQVQQRQHLPQQVPKNRDREFVEEQKAQYRLPNKHTSRANALISPEENFMRVPQLHQNQLRSTQLPYPRPTMCKAGAFDPLATQSSSTSMPMHVESSSVKHSEQSIAHIPQLVTRQQHGSFQGEVNRERRVIAPQQKSIGQVSVRSNNRQNQLLRVSDPKLSSVHDVDQQKHLASAHPRLLAGQISTHKQQQTQHTLRQHATPLVQRGDSLGAQQVPSEFSSSQGERSHEQIMSQRQVVRMEKKPSSGVTSESPNLLRPKMESGSAPLDASKTNEVSSSGERHGDVEPWREEIYQRITAMKNKYLSTVTEMYYWIDTKLKQLDLKPEHPEKEKFEKKLKDAKHLVERFIRMLNIPKAKLIPGHRENLDVWEKNIVFYLNKYFTSRNVTASLQKGQDPRHGSQSLPQSLPPQQAHTPHQLVESSGVKEKHLADQLGSKLKGPQTDQPGRNLLHPRDSGEDISGTPSLQTPRDKGENHQAEAQTPAAPSPLMILTPGISTSPLLLECENLNENPGNNTRVSIPDKTSVSQSPIQRLLNAVNSISSRALKSSMDDIFSVTSMIDGFEPTPPGFSSKSAIGEDLVGTTGCRMQARNFVGTEKWKRGRSINPVPIIESDGEISAENHRKRAKIEISNKLLEEIKYVNDRLIDTMVDICDEDYNGSSSSSNSSKTGTLVKCYFNGISVAKFMNSTIEPLCLLVPEEYPDCSPILLDKLPSDDGDEYKDFSEKAKSRLGRSLRGLKNPISISEIARTWEVCARAVITEHAEKCGGGTFSSIYGTWENCLSTV